MSTRIRSRRRPRPARLVAAAFVVSGLVGAGVAPQGVGMGPVTVDAAVAAKPAAAPTASVSRPAAARSSAGRRAKVQPTTEIEHRIQYQYNSLGRRDPFTPLIDGFVPVTEGGKAPVDVGGIKVVGIVWGPDSFALVEDGRGNSLILRRGDKVMNGYVEEMRRDAMVAKLTMDGQTQSVVIPLTRKGDRANASR